MRRHAGVSRKGDTGALVIVLEIQNILGKGGVSRECNSTCVFSKSNQVCDTERTAGRSKQLYTARGVYGRRILPLVRNTAVIAQAVKSDTPCSRKRRRIAGVRVGHGA